MADKTPIPRICDNPADFDDALYGVYQEYQVRNGFRVYISLNCGQGLNRLVYHSGYNQWCVSRNAREDHFARPMTAAERAEYQTALKYNIIGVWATMLCGDERELHRSTCNNWVYPAGR